MHPNYRKQGVGEALIRSVFKLAKETDCVRVDLGTEITNTTAQKLYEKLGFIKDTEFFAYSYTL